ncbi:MAG TPA: hemolysin family protein, partial [Allocoleopsis sp.]
TTKLDSEQRQFLKNVFQFQDVLVSEVMVTRNNIKAISATANLQDLFTKMAKYGYNRYPVICDSLDDIKGMISVKELIPILATGNIDLNSLIETWMIPIKFIPEFTSLSELLSMMQKDKLSMVIVVDEFGSTVGLITLNDIIAEIIGGDNQSENQQQLTVQKLDHKTFIIQAQTHIEEVNQILNINLPIIDEYQTLGGFILYQFQKIPQQGEILQFDNLEITVISCENRRLEQVKLTIKN